MKNIQPNAIILSALAAMFFVFAIRTGSAWGQTMTMAAFSSACVAMQTPNSPAPPVQPKV